MLYEIENDRLVSIDYGGILNNVSFDYPLTQLTETDSILCSDLFAHICNSVTQKSLEAVLLRLEKDYQRCINQSRKQLYIADKMPREWVVPTDKITKKLNELISTAWIDSTWTNFVECLKSSSNYGK